MANPREQGSLSDWDKDVRDPLAIEQASVHVRGEVPLVLISFRGDGGFLDLTHQGVQFIGELEVLQVSAGLSVARWQHGKPA